MQHRHSHLHAAKEVPIAPNSFWKVVDYAAVHSAAGIARTIVAEFSCLVKIVGK